VSRVHQQVVTVESLIHPSYQRTTAVRRVAKRPRSSVDEGTSVDGLMVDLLREVAKPYLPLVDYFKADTQSSAHDTAATDTETPSGQSVQRGNISLRSVPSRPAVVPATTSKAAVVQQSDPNLIARTPAKAKPCGSCPALRGGLCRCALKRARRG